MLLLHFTVCAGICAMDSLADASVEMLTSRCILHTNSIGKKMMHMKKNVLVKTVSLLVDERQELCVSAYCAYWFPNFRSVRVKR